MFRFIEVTWGEVYGVVRTMTFDIDAKIEAFVKEVPEVVSIQLRAEDRVAMH
jgi:hypothetical protein